MEESAGSVGWGWTLNPGCITRSLMGLPDDFCQDLIVKQFSVKDNSTYGGKVGADLEIAGLSSIIGVNIGAEIGVFYNTYKGWGLEPSLRGSLSASYSANSGLGGSASLGLGITVNSQTGVDKYISPSVGIKLGNPGNRLSINLGKTWSVNSNEGLKTSVNTGLSYSIYNGGTAKGFDKSGTVDYRDQTSFSIMGASTRTCLNNSFNPDIEYPFENRSGTYSGSLGIDAYYVDPNIRLTGYFSEQTLATKTQSFPAFGCMYDLDGMPPNAMLDFNREKKLPYFIGQSPILPIPYRTPDIFNVNAQGISFTFSVSKNDIGVVGDAQVFVNSNGTQIGLEANLGGLLKAGGNYGTTTSSQSTGRWDPPQFKFFPDQEVLNNGNLYQQFCFKNHGELNIFRHTAFENNILGRYTPVKFTIWDANGEPTRLNNGYNTNPLLRNEFQPVRQTNISYLTAKQASMIGFDKTISCYDMDMEVNSGNNWIPLAQIPRNGGFRKDHHLSEITVTQPDGMRYIFGIPVYNTFQKEATFNIGNITLDASGMEKNLVPYTPPTDNSTANLKGFDNFYESTETPPYATQFLITAVLSQDYRDITGDGITSDDPGNYVKFRYFRENFLYKWRTPFAKNQATFNQGLRSDEEDAKGSYVYGEKEIYYIQSTESKFEIAEFHYKDRLDGFGVIDENGGKDPKMKLRQLYKIVVYSKPDRDHNGNNAIPIKTIFFNQDNSLCAGIDNGDQPTTGKLTLKQVAITYENSLKGLHTPYVFEYGNMPQGGNPNNPHYSVRNVNRWGYFQENPNGIFSDCENNSTSGLSNIDFPYACQDDRNTMNDNAYAWNLTDIILPGGGKIKVNYEAHDYAYMQDKPAGQMFKVVGVTTPNGTSLYDNPSIIYIKLTAPLTSNQNDWKKEFGEKYLKDIREGYLYYKFYVRLRDDKFDYITGYAQVTDYGVDNSGTYGFIILKEVNLDEEKSYDPCSPILKAALQFMRINRNTLVFSNSTPQPADLKGFITQLPSVFEQLKNQLDVSVIGANHYCKTKGYCQYIVPTRSFIRLYNPTGIKVAGGSRVKEISIDDQFGEMTGNDHPGKSYTTSYEYLTEDKDPVTQQPIIISSGVATSEPMVGNDESALKQPLLYADKKDKATDVDYYVETPVNESRFPAPQIYYSKVTQVNNKTSYDVGKTGKIVNEYFTSKDYPVKVDRTTIDEQRDKTDPNSLQVGFFSDDEQHDYATVSQGFYIEQTNGPGLPKSTWVYNEKGDRISGEVYEYYPDNDHFTTIDKYGNIHRNNQQLGMDIQYTVDGRISKDESETDVKQLNLNVAMFGPVPVPLLVPLFSTLTEKKQFRSLVINKEINRNLVLKKKTVFEQSASISTENLAFDEVTGEAILTKTTNEFNDTLFSFKYPAWWMYEGMGPAFITSGLHLTSSSFNTSLTLLKQGDEFAKLTNGHRFWITNVNTGSVEVVDQDNQSSTVNGISDTYILTNPAAKNVLTSGAGQVVTWNYNPILTDNKITFAPSSILNSSAIEYYDSAVIHCDTCWEITSLKKENDFLSGRKGNWKPKQTWFYLTDRTGLNINTGISNIREQGLFNDYHDFWMVPGTPANPADYWRISNSNWEWKEKVNLTDVYGLTLETEDRIGRKVASLPGFRNTLVTAQAYNSAYHEVFSDGFEEYEFTYCPVPRISDPIDPTIYQASHQYMKRVQLIQGPLVIDNRESHTGKYSVKVTKPVTFREIIQDPNCHNTGVHEIFYDDGGNESFVVSPNIYRLDAVRFTPEPCKTIIIAVKVYIGDAKDYNPGTTPSSLPPFQIQFYDMAMGLITTFTGVPANFGWNTFPLPVPYTLTDPVYIGKVRLQGKSYPQEAGVGVDNTTSSQRSYEYDGTAMSAFSGNFMIRAVVAGEGTECADGFYTLKDKKYVFSCWVKVNGIQPVLSCSDASVQIKSDGASVSVLRPEGAMIDGWQRIIGTFKKSASNNIISVTLNNAPFPTYYDDIRIFPDSGNMISYVYDDVNRRMTFMLDENNYFTKYEYNNQGELIRFKKELEKGIVTFKEANQALTKKP
jgi:hypothetical protein